MKPARARPNFLPAISSFQRGKTAGKDAPRAKPAKSPGLSNYLTSSRVFILVRGRATLAETSEVIPRCYRRAGEWPIPRAVAITYHREFILLLSINGAGGAGGGREPGAEGGEGASQESRRSESAAHLFDSSWLPGVPGRRFIPVTISRSRDPTIRRSLRRRHAQWLIVKKQNGS